MARSSSRPKAFPRLKRSRVPVFIGIQTAVLAAALGLGLPTLYALFIPLSAGGAAFLTRQGPLGTALATAGGLLLVTLGLPIALFVAGQDPGQILDKALDPAVHRTLYLGIYGSLLAASASVLTGVPLALCLSRGFPGQSLVESLVDLPLVVPHSVAGIMVLFAFGKGGAFPDLTVLGTLAGMVLALVFVSAPYAVNGARQAFDAVPRRLEYAARVHGAGPWRTLRRVTLPLAGRGILIGGVLAWARAVSEFGAVAVVAYSVRFFYPFSGETATSQHAPVFVYNTYLSGGLAESGGVGFLLLCVSAVIFLAIRGLASGGEGPGQRLV